MPSYYNEIEPFAADWLENLIKENLIAPGVVDRRSITEVTPNDLKDFTQCHFFAGIGGWSLALRLAGWPDDKPVWTGSCPCQPFSVAGKARGTDDPRHLWPEFARLIGKCRPARVFGEQVASKAGRAWLAGVRADLEALGYGVGAADLCAAGVGAPHIRQRLYWMAAAMRDGAEPRSSGGDRQEEAAFSQTGGKTPRPISPPWVCGSLGGVADADKGERGRFANGEGRECHRAAAGREQGHGEPERGGATGGLDGVDQPGPQGLAGHGDNWRQPGRLDQEQDGPVTAPGGACLWDRYDLIPCADRKARRIEPGSFPLAYGVPNRVGRLRAYGNAIVPQVAAAFINAAS